jgi:hypothetical protein
MPIKAWLIWWIAAAIFFSAVVGFGTGWSILFGLLFVVLTELLHYIFNKTGGW